MIQAIRQFSTHRYPLFSSTISAGFPSPADEFIEVKLDLNELLVKHPVATFFMRVSGNSRQDCGIQDGDILIVDRSLTPTNGKIVIAIIDGQLTVKRLKKTKNKIYFMPENENFSVPEIKPENEIYIWGVVTYIIHNI
jgi:DNA polymerase V